MTRSGSEDEPAPDNTQHAHDDLIRAIEPGNTQLDDTHDEPYNLETILDDEAHNSFTTVDLRAIEPGHTQHCDTRRRAIEPGNTHCHDIEDEP